MLTRYIGSTISTVEQRMRWHRNSQTAEWNPDLHKLVCDGDPAWKILAVVDNAERFEIEAELTRRYRQHHKIFNVLDGQRHTPESVRRIQAGKRASRAGFRGSAGP